MNAVINLNKPENISSQQAVTKIKRLLRVKKAGHTGTLDPLATGVLVVCLNEATKIARFLSDLDKEYIVKMKLGERTDTYDSTGRVTEKKPIGSVHDSDILHVLNIFTGQIQQIPPMYSAVKIHGDRLYKLARKGLEIERPERTVIIHALELLDMDLPYIDMKVACSKGTYIRTLCDDIGNILGTGAHMTSLKRTRIGTFRIEDSIPIEEIGERKKGFYTIDAALSHLSEIILDEDSYLKARNGVAVGLSEASLKGDREEFRKVDESVSENSCINQYVRLKNQDLQVFGIGKREKNRIKIERLLN
jgi:tRNA pseudouridine55 synthase